MHLSVYRRPLIRYNQRHEEVPFPRDAGHPLPTRHSSHTYRHSSHTLQRRPNAPERTQRLCKILILMPREGSIRERLGNKSWTRKESPLQSVLRLESRARCSPMLPAALSWTLVTQGTVQGEGCTPSNPLMLRPTRISTTCSPHRSRSRRSQQHEMRPLGLPLPLHLQHHPPLLLRRARAVRGLPWIRNCTTVARHRHLPGRACQVVQRAPPGNSQGRAPPMAS